MLSNALKAHEAAALESQAMSSQQQNSPRRMIQNLPRKPLTASQSNAQRPFKPLTMKQFSTDSTLAKKSSLVDATTAHPHLKRDRSGQVKGFEASFEDDENIVAKPVLGNALKNDVKETVLMYESDFGSDIDLDGEDTKPSVSYPSMSPIPKSTGAPRQILYPTLPRQQQYQTPYVDLTNSENLLSSSMPADWSSSPPQHMLAKDAMTQPLWPDTRIKSEVSSPKTKSRKLPWASLQKSTVVTEKSLATPTPKTSKTNDFLYHSESAVKEQRNKHREEARKAVKREDEPAKPPVMAKQKRVPKVFLSEEQQHVLNIVVEQKESVFFTGSAGTGKSVLLREIITALRKKHAREPDRIAVTASTGLAACNIGGVTLHSFAGIGLGKEEVPDLVKKIKRNQKARHRWLRTKVLIIDEVSMVDGDLFDKLEAVARQLRNNGRPFGGIQLVITGDFFQLPPVPEHGRQAKFSFDASTWKTVITNTIGLHQVFRQKDPVFAGILNEMREGRLSESSVKLFKNLERDLSFEDSIEATALFPLRQEVDRANNQKLGRLNGREFVFEARDGGAIADKGQRDKLLSNCMAPAEITLKKGAQVMLIKNVDETLVNGSLGKVIAFMDNTQFDKFTLNEELYHQDDEGIFITQDEEGLSKEEKARRRITDNLSINNTSRQYPLVRFNIPDGTTRDMLCEPETWKIELPSGEVQASRQQIPLILSWALSIHKAQGQTMERVTVDLNKVFEKGQAYVALSRATSMNGLQVKGFHHTKVMAHDRVIQFYRNLARVKLENSVSAAKAEK